MFFILVLPYNQPTLSCHASWDSNAITIINSSQLPYQPTRIFMTKNNTWYVAPDNIAQIVSGIETNITPTIGVSSGNCLFVSSNDDIFTCGGYSDQVIKWSMNRTISEPVLFITSDCAGVRVSANNTLYCSLPQMHQVIAKSLDDPTNTFVIVAGTGCASSSATELNRPVGIFVDRNSSLYVSDSNNGRVQLFHSGQTSATTVAGTGAPGTIILLYPTDVVLDGDGYVFVVDQNSHHVVGSGPDGFRCVAGCSGGSGSAPNQLYNPQSMVFDSNGNIWVADTDNRRIQKFLLRTNSCGECLALEQNRKHLQKPAQFYCNLRAVHRG